MRYLTFVFCVVFALPAAAQLSEDTSQLTARDLAKLAAAKEKKCNNTLNTIQAILARQTLKDIIRDTYFVTRANGYITVYNSMGCEADPLLNVLNRAPFLKK